MSRVDAAILHVVIWCLWGWHTIRDARLRRRYP